jgi:hypothetical protein
MRGRSVSPQGAETGQARRIGDGARFPLVKSMLSEQVRHLCDIVHPAWNVAGLFARVHEPKRLEFLPFDQTALYFEPGLGVSNKLAGDFFLEKLGGSA